SADDCQLESTALGDKRLFVLLWCGRINPAIEREVPAWIEPRVMRYAHVGARTNLLHSSGVLARHTAIDGLGLESGPGRARIGMPQANETCAVALGLGTDHETEGPAGLNTPPVGIT